MTTTTTTTTTTKALRIESGQYEFFIAAPMNQDHESMALLSNFRRCLCKKYPALKARFVSVRAEDLPSGPPNMVVGRQLGLTIS